MYYIKNLRYRINNIKLDGFDKQTYVNSLYSIFSFYNVKFVQMIKKIHIKNFKSIRDISLEIPNFAALVGNNGSGKTNFLRAISLISLLAKGEKIEEALKELELVTSELLFDKNNPKIEFSIDLLINGRSVSYSFTIEQKEGEGVYKVFQETLVNGIDKPILERNDEQITIGAEQEDQLKEAQLISNQLAMSVFKKPTLIAEVQSALSSIVVIKAGVEKFREFGQFTNVQSNLITNLVEGLYKLKTSDPTGYEKLIREFNEMVPDMNELDVRQNGDRLALVYKDKSLQDREFSAFSASDGNLRSLYILSKVISKPKPSVLLIDEIENSLYPKRIQLIIKFLEYIAGSETTSFQVIVTTHSPIVLNYLGSNQVIYVYKTAGESKIVNPYKNSRVRNHLEKVEDEGAGLGTLFATGLLEDIFSSNSE